MNACMCVHMYMHMGLDPCVRGLQREHVCMHVSRCFDSTYTAGWQPGVWAESLGGAGQLPLTCSREGVGEAVRQLDCPGCEPGGREEGRRASGRRYWELAPPRPHSAVLVPHRGVGWGGGGKLG